MRPEILFPLFAPVTSLSGVGPRFAKLFEGLAGGHLLDLCFHLPSGIIDRRYAPKLAEAIPGKIATLTVRVTEHRAPANRRQPYRVHCADDSGTIELVFFHAKPDYLLRMLPEGEERVISGKVEVFGEHLQMTHPDHIGEPKDLESIKSVEPVYPLTAGLSLKVVGKAVQAALAETPALPGPNLPDWLDPAHKSRQDWPSWRDALLAVHAPHDEGDLSALAPLRCRLAYDELLANQLALGLVRAHQVRQKGRPIRGDGRLRAAVLSALPFTPTGSQEHALAEIIADMASEHRMLRLLQGDVGSGKTLVALLAMVAAIEAGGQAAIMAPTEILARQHLATIAPLAKAAGISVALLTGRDKGKARSQILAGIESGETGIVIGTHALFQDDVAFQNLVLAVIDEQHRFGVHQRLLLSTKGKAVDVLVMTATPIPRTLMLTAYGDMEVSKLTEKPAGRQPIETLAISHDRLHEVVDAVARALAAGTKVYWVCPLVEDSELVDLAAAEDRAAELRGRFGDQVGLVHGRMKGPEKDAVMARFAGKTAPGAGAQGELLNGSDASESGEVDLLVATTVIEVGVDVPAATVMVIEHAERFGLAQLHQLRGRIGRGSEKSRCLLVYQGPLGETARARLRIMRETDDGFRIAEEDLRLRGAGELLGTRQSGMPEFRLADLAVHGELLATARDDARLILERDLELESERGQALRVLLYLFERDAAVRYLRSG